MHLQHTFNILECSFSQARDQYMEKITVGAKIKRIPALKQEQQFYIWGLDQAPEQ